MTNPNMPIVTVDRNARTLPPSFSVTLKRVSGGETSTALAVANGLSEAHATLVAAELRGAIADAYHVGAESKFTAGERAAIDAERRRARAEASLAPGEPDADERWYALNDGWVH